MAGENTYTKIVQELGKFSEKDLIQIPLLNFIWLFILLYLIKFILNFIKLLIKIIIFITILIIIIRVVVELLKINKINVPEFRICNLIKSFSNFWKEISNYLF